MASEDHSGGRSPDEASKRSTSTPDWAGGLKQLYDSVVEEPLPDAFKDLLDKLDDGAMPTSEGDCTADGSGEG